MLRFPPAVKGEHVRLGTLLHCPWPNHWPQSFSWSPGSARCSSVTRMGQMQRTNGPTRFNKVYFSVSYYTGKCVILKAGLCTCVGVRVLAHTPVSSYSGSPARRSARCVCGRWWRCASCAWRSPATTCRPTSTWRPSGWGRWRGRRAASPPWTSRERWSARGGVPPNGGGGMFWTEHSNADATVATDGWMQRSSGTPSKSSRTLLHSIRRIVLLHQHWNVQFRTF